MFVRRFGRQLAGLVLGSMWLFAAYGCGDDSAAKPSDAAPKCVRGTVYECFRRGCKGHQVCASDGTMSACICDPNNAGKGADELDSGEPLDASTAPVASDTPDATPAGWKGPIELRTSASGTPNCDKTSGKSVFEAGEGPSAAAMSCSECSCTPAAAGCAAFVDFGTGTTAGCGGTTCTTSVNQSCSEIMPPCLASVSSAYLQTKLPSAAEGCTPSSQTPSKPSVKWAKRVVGCDAGEPECVWRDGDHDCPREAYTGKRLYYRGVTDDRTCSACSCGGPDCSYKWSVFNAGDSSCAAPIITLNAEGQCVQVNPSMDKLRVGASISGDGSCKPSGGVSQGEVSGADAITVCCRP